MSLMRGRVWGEARISQCVFVSLYINKMHELLSHIVNFTVCTFEILVIKDQKMMIIYLSQH